MQRRRSTLLMRLGCAALIATALWPATLSSADAGSGFRDPGAHRAPAAAAGNWAWPLPGVPRITRGFQPPETTYGRGHRGVDLAGSPGEQVLAAGAGTVTFAGLVAGRGVVTVSHSAGLRTTYEPVTASVGRGQTVGVGAPIGHLVVGHLGCPVVACLHWGLLRGTTYLDPLSLLRAGRVRLLPLVGAPP